MDIREIKVLAQKNLEGKWGTYVLAAFIMFVALTAGNGSGLLWIVILPLYVGYATLHVNLAKGKKSEIETIFEGFQKNYGGNLLALLLRTVYTFLWTLCLIIPGIVKGLSYAMTHYILQDEDFDEIDQLAIDKSIEMMDGYKFDLFVLYLSFILWFLLTAITFGVLWLYVGPYFEQSIAIFYLKVKEEKYGSFEEKEINNTDNYYE